MFLETEATDNYEDSHGEVSVSWIYVLLRVLAIPAIVACVALLL